MVTNSTYVGRVGLALDQFLNTIIFDGEADETISLHAAEAQQDGKRWGCFFCWWLSHTIEQNHCARTLRGISITEVGGIRAFGQLIAVFLSITFLLWFWG